jgi:hypothetical protein
MPWALMLLGLHCFFQFERMRNEEQVLIRAFENIGNICRGRHDCFLAYIDCVE